MNPSVYLLSRSVFPFIELKILRISTYATVKIINDIASGLFPFLNWINHYNLQWLVGDVIAGMESPRFHHSPCVLTKTGDTVNPCQRKGPRETWRLARRSVHARDVTSGLSHLRKIHAVTRLALLGSRGPLFPY
jgi:hypothetical protein